MIRHIFQTFLTKDTHPLLGRWKLKQNCKSEEIVVHHANRDNCGDVLCGNPKKYAEFTDLKIKNDIKKNEQ
jgi:hypothetical protein